MQYGSCSFADVYVQFWWLFEFFVVKVLYVRRCCAYLCLNFTWHRTQLCINTAIVYMHRFYMFHSFVKFNRTVNSFTLSCALMLLILPIYWCLVLMNRALC